MFFLFSFAYRIGLPILILLCDEDVAKTIFFTGIITTWTTQFERYGLQILTHLLKQLKKLQI